MSLRGLGLSLVLLIGCLSPCLAGVSSSTFEAANKLYEEGKFTEAVSAYEKLLQGGQASAAVYFNLGNAYFKSSQIGRALDAYRRAARITPRDPDVRANLQFARNQVPGPSLSAGRWQRWLSELSLNEWTVLAMGAFWLLLLLLAVLQWRPAWRTSLRTWLISSGFATAVLFACLAGAWYQARALARVIVVKPEVVVRHGPLDESQSAFTVHDGAELRVLDQKDNWLQVSAGPLRIGWLRRDQVVSTE